MSKISLPVTYIKGYTNPSDKSLPTNPLPNLPLPSTQSDSPTLSLPSVDLNKPVTVTSLPESNQIEMYQNQSNNLYTEIKVLNNRLYHLENKLILSLVILLIIVLIITVFIGYYMLKPSKTNNDKCKHENQEKHTAADWFLMTALLLTSLVIIVVIAFLLLNY